MSLMDLNKIILKLICTKNTCKNTNLKKKKRTMKGLCPSKEQIYLKVLVIKTEGIDRKISLKQSRIKTQTHLCSISYREGSLTRERIGFVLLNFVSGFGLGDR